MSILSALKTKGAKGNNIEEAVKTLPVGNSGGGNLVISETIEESDNNTIHTLNVTFNDMANAIKDGNFLVIQDIDEQPFGVSYGLHISDFGPVHITDYTATEVEKNGYYLPSPFEDESGHWFYSETPDGTMAYITHK